MQPPARARHFTSIDVLRGVAAMAVCFYHFTRSDFLGHNVLQRFASLGHLGVEIFFVVSGYVICASLDRANYTHRQFPAFLARRFARIYPPFVIAGLGSFLLWMLSSKVPMFMGHPPVIAVRQWVTNLTFTAEFFHEAWVIPVFWTLAIEAQYYIVLGLSFGGIVHRNYAVRVGYLLLWIVMPLLVHFHPLVTSFGALFGFGLIWFAVDSGRISRRVGAWLTLAAFLSHGVVGGWPGACAGVATLSILAFAPYIKSRAWVFLGGISYSLYLVHVPIGGRVINLLSRGPDNFWFRLVAVAAAYFVSIAAAYIFYRLVEGPCHAWAKRISVRARG